MKKLFLVLVVCLVCAPLMAAAEQIKVEGDQAKVLGYGLEFDTARQGKVAVTMGNEAIYLNNDLNSASFKKDAEHTLKHNLHYSCLACDKHSRTPGKCPCGAVLAPSFKHGDTWHLVGKDASGQLVVDNNAPAPAPVAAPCCIGTDGKPCDPTTCQKPCDKTACQQPCGTVAPHDCQGASCDICAAAGCNKCGTCMKKSGKKQGKKKHPGKKKEKKDAVAPAKDEPKQEEPKKDEPKKDEPKQEEPKTDAPAPAGK